MLYVQGNCLSNYLSFLSLHQGGKRPTGILEELLPELRSGWKRPKGWTVVTARICYPDPHRNARLTSSLCECWKQKPSALGHLCRPASAEESCLTQGHTSFLGWLGSDNWLTLKCIDLVPGSPQDTLKNHARFRTLQRVGWDLCWDASQFNLSLCPVLILECSCLLLFISEFFSQGTQPMIYTKIQATKTIVYNRQWYLLWMVPDKHQYVHCPTCLHHSLLLIIIIWSLGWEDILE